ncbi:MAG: hypothetical protein EBU54_17035 [Mycobacteriaceae bacterium]|nr:hypothetical protein [Mycobacteriaceae bacterium]
MLAIGASPALAGLGPQDGNSVTIVVSGPGILTVNGWLSVDPAGLPVSTFTLVPNQDPLVAMAVPYGSGEFAGWGGTCTGNFETCIVDMSQDQCLIAGFQPIGGPPIDLAALNTYCPQAVGGNGTPPPAASTSPGSSGGSTGAAPGGTSGGASGPAPAVVIAPGAPALARAASRVQGMATVVTGVLPPTARKVVSSASYLAASGSVRSAGTCTIRRRGAARAFTCRARTPLKGRWQVVTQALDAKKHVVGQATSVLTVR